MLEKHKLYEVEYTKLDKSETTQRKIIPTFVPSPNVKAIDVSELSESEAEQMRQNLVEYSKYYEQAAKNIYSFEDWLSHTSRRVSKPPKWRTFAIENLAILE